MSDVTGSIIILLKSVNRSNSDRLKNTKRKLAILMGDVDCHDYFDYHWYVKFSECSVVDRYLWEVSLKTDKFIIEYNIKNIGILILVLRGNKWQI